MITKMKTLRIILALILTTTIFACEDKNIFPDPMSLPVKALELNVEIMDIFSLPDDRAAAFVKLDKQSTDTKDAYQLAIIDKVLELNKSVQLLTEDDIIQMIAEV
jgi:hypothetical protein